MSELILFIKTHGVDKGYKLYPAKMRELEAQIKRGKPIKEVWDK